MQQEYFIQMLMPYIVICELDEVCVNICGDCKAYPIPIRRPPRPIRSPSSSYVRVRLLRFSLKNHDPHATHGHIYSMYIINKE